MLLRAAGRRRDGGGRARAAGARRPGRDRGRGPAGARSRAARDREASIWSCRARASPPARYADHGGRVWGDIELAWRALSVPIVAVTGTNGKSTTTRLIEAMLRAAGPARRGGRQHRRAGARSGGASARRGRARGLVVPARDDRGASGRRWRCCSTSRPTTWIVTATSPATSRRRPASSRTSEPSDTAVLSADDALVRDLAKTTRAPVRFFSQREVLPRGACLDAGALILRDENAMVRVPLELPALPGAHNRENVLAALLAVHALGADAARASTRARWLFAGFRTGWRSCASGAASRGSTTPRGPT